MYSRSLASYLCANRLSHFNAPHSSSLSVSLQMALSISAVGSLSNSSNLCILKYSSKGSVSQTKCCWMTLQSCQKREQSFSSSYSSSDDATVSIDREEIFQRRKVLLLSAFGLILRGFQIAPENGVAVATEYADMPALRGKDYGKTKMRFPDYTETKSGLQYKDLRVGSGPTPKIGDTVVVDWDGYTIGYYGRIFEARNKTKGGSFEGGDKDFFKFSLGSQQVIPAFEEAVSGMSPGGVRRIIVPPELGYPENDYNKQGPRPTTFSGQRALDFVLRNQGLIDKTLLFDIELLKVIPN